jgi:hypothetical protein
MLTSDGHVWYDIPCLRLWMKKLVVNFYNKPIINKLKKSFQKPKNHSFKQYVQAN